MITAMNVYFYLFICFVGFKNLNMSFWQDLQGRIRLISKYGCVFTLNFVTLMNALMGNHLVRYNSQVARQNRMLLRNDLINTDNFSKNTKKVAYAFS